MFSQPHKTNSEQGYTVRRTSITALTISFISFSVVCGAWIYSNNQKEAADIKDQRLIHALACDVANSSNTDCRAELARVAAKFKRRSYRDISRGEAADAVAYLQSRLDEVE